MKVCDRHGRVVPLGSKLGAGGEGSVFDVHDHRKLAAKIYHHPIPNEKAAKLVHMAGLSTPALLELSAWPVDVLYDRPGGSAVGLVMPKVEGYKPIHLLYSPKSRQKEFPDAQWPFLIHTAVNVARAFAAVHGHGHVVGDVNHGNLLVSAQGTVRFIDCDSFQIHAQGHHFLCEVGVSTHTPPELQGISFKTALRTPNHDAFGLAVVVFQLLFMGRHPFSGGYIGRGDMPLEQAIKDSRFAYGPGAAARQMIQPPGTPPLDACGPLASLFERAFGSPANKRPTALEWRNGLQTLLQSLRQCQANPSHHHLRTTATCPWCAIERQSGFLFFTITAAQIKGAAMNFDVAAVWQRIKSIRPPVQMPMPQASVYGTRPSPQVAAAKSRAKTMKVIGWIVAIAGVMAGPIGGNVGVLLVIGGLLLGIIIGNSGRDKELQSRVCDEERQASRHYDELKVRWAAIGNGNRFSGRLAELERLKSEYDQLPDERRRRLSLLEAERRERQLEAFLDRFRLDAANIQGIGEGRKATLQSYGVETAADVRKSKILNIPGFGPALTNRLLAWQKTITASLSSTPTKAWIPPRQPRSRPRSCGESRRSRRPWPVAPRSCRPLSRRRRRR